MKTFRFETCSFMRVLAVLVTIAAAAGELKAAELPKLKVSENGRFLVREDGVPFFWLGDTAWRLAGQSMADVDLYLSDRTEKGFNVIQVEVGSPGRANSQAARPYLNNNTDTPSEAYWQHIDAMVDQAGSCGLYVALVTMWGNDFPTAFGSDPQKAHRLGKWLAGRYRTRNHVLWIVSGEYDSINGYRLPITAGQKALFHALARGLDDGHGNTQLMTIHPGIAYTSSRDFHNESWLDFNMLQSGHEIDREAYRHPENHTSIATDYRLSPTKPVLDGEPFYEDTPDGVWVHRSTNRPRGDADVVRRKAYWAVFAGACGHTYGHNEVCICWIPGAPTEPPAASGQRTHWKMSLNAPGAGQMRHLRALLESRPFLEGIPDPSLLASPAGKGNDHVCATRASTGSYAMAYLPAGGAVTIDMSKIAGDTVKAHWYNPREGTATLIGPFRNTGHQVFTPPTNGAGNDWVLVLDDAAQGFPPPGSTPALGSKQAPPGRV